MRQYFSLSQNSSFRGRQCIALPIALNKHLFRASEHLNFSQRYGIQQLQPLQDLNRPIELGNDR